MQKRNPQPCKAQEISVYIKITFFTPAFFYFVSTSSSQNHLIKSGT